MTNNNENIPTLHFPKEITDLLTLISEQQTAQIRMCRTLLAGFKATNEQDIYYMDHLMDPLMDFMDQGDETEDLYCDYIAHIASFDAQEREKRLEDLEEILDTGQKPSMPQHTWQIAIWNQDPDDHSWKYEFDELMPFPGETSLTPSEKDWKEIAVMLEYLNEQTAQNHEDYLERFRNNIDALHVKLKDLEFGPLGTKHHDYKPLINMLHEYHSKNGL